MRTGCSFTRTACFAFNKFGKLELGLKFNLFLRCFFALISCGDYQLGLDNEKIDRLYVLSDIF